VFFSDASLFTYKQEPAADGLPRAVLLPVGNGSLVPWEQKICSQVCRKLWHLCFCVVDKWSPFWAIWSYIPALISLIMIVWGVYGVSACGVPVYSPAFACCCCTCRWKRMSWRRWLITYGDASTLIQLHLSTNQAQCRAAALIQTNMLPLCQGEVDNSQTCSCFSNHCTKIRPC